MTDQYVQLAPDSSGKKIDTSELTVNGQTVERQRVVIADDSSATGLAGVANGALQTQAQGLAMVGYTPSPSASTADAGVGNLPAQIDPAGQIMTRSTVFTDEGSLRDDFLGSATIISLTGTITVNNGSTQVVGASTLFTSEVDNADFIKITSHTEAMWTKVESVEDNTHLTLAQGYLGANAAAAAASYTDWPTVTTGSGASTTQGSSLLNVATGTTSGAGITYWRDADYQPMSFIIRCSVSQAIANQEFGFGFTNNVTTPGQQARVIISGTDSTKVTFQVGTASDAANYQSVVVTLPAAAVYTSQQVYQIDLTPDAAVLTVNGVVSAQFGYHLPYPYQLLNIFAYGKNTGVAGSTSTLAVDWIALNNFDQVQIAARAPLPISGRTTDTPPQTQPLPLTTAGRSVNVAQVTDINRTAVSFFLDETAGVAAETLATMAIAKAGATVTGTNSYTVTSGKTLRLTSFSFSVRSTSATQNNSRVRIRTAAGTVATNSAVVAHLGGGTPVATSGGTFGNQTSFGEGYEIAGGTQIGITHFETATTCAITVTVTGYEY